jgi:hypothetical protein
MRLIPRPKPAPILKLVVKNPPQQDSKVLPKSHQSELPKKSILRRPSRPEYDPNEFVELPAKKKLVKRSHSKNLPVDYLEVPINQIPVPPPVEVEGEEEYVVERIVDSYGKEMQQNIL